MTLLSRLGALEREYIKASSEGLLTPLQNFMDGEMRNVLREKKLLENRRLELDTCRSRLRKAKSTEEQEQVNKVNEIY